MYNSIWYNNLTKPKFVPPNSIFIPAWTFLYIIIGVSLLIYMLKQTEENKKIGLIFFFTQLGLNFLWAPIFFGLQNIFLGLLVLILLDIFAFLTAKEFYKISKISGLLLIPYILWLIYATYLNIGYLILN